MAFSPLRLATSNLSSTFSKSANMLSVSFERAGRLSGRPASSVPPLKRNLNQVFLRLLGLLIRTGGRRHALASRLDFDDLVLLDAVSVLGNFEHHHTLAADKVLRSPPELRV